MLQIKINKLIVLGIALAILFYSSCNKNDSLNNSTSNLDQRIKEAWLHKSSDCGPCDEYKKSLKNDPNLKDLLASFDSFYYCIPCENSGSDCINGYTCFANTSYDPNAIGNLSNVDGGIILYDKYRYFSNAINNLKNLKKDYYDLHNKYGDYLYYSVSLKDTPWIVPSVVGFLYDEKETDLGHNGSLLFWQLDPYLDKNRKFQINTSWDGSAAGQEKDTIYFKILDKYITFENKYTKRYHYFYYFTLSPNREQMNMRIDLYDAEKGEYPAQTPPSKVINHTLYKYHP